MTKRQVTILIIGCFLSYLLLGYVDDLNGSTISYVLSDQGFLYSTGGTIIFFKYFGLFIASFLAGVLADKFGKKFALLAASACLIIGVAGFAFASSLIVFICFDFIIGLGQGALELGGSHIMSSLQTEHKGRYLNLLNAFYGIGAIFTPILTSRLIGASLSWRSVYLVSLAVIFPITIYFIIMKCPKDSVQEQTQREPVKASAYFSRGMVLMYICIFAYCAAEVGVASWMVDFLTNEKMMSGAVSANFLSLHFFGMMLGRLLASLFVDRLGHLRSLLLFSVLSILFISTGVFGPASLAFVIAFTGFGFSLIYPTATAVVTDMEGGQNGTGLGIFISASGLGCMVGPWIVGIVNDHLGLTSGMATNVLYCVVVVITVLLSMGLQKAKEH